MYDIDIRYRIPINMKDFGLVVFCVYIVPLFYLNCVLKGYSRWTWSLQRNGKAFQSPVEVFWIEVQPIWNATQELMDWSRIGSRELSCRIILAHEITMIVKVHFTIFHIYRYTISYIDIVQYIGATLFDIVYNIGYDIIYDV